MSVKAWAFKLKPGADLVVRKDDSGRICLVGNISPEFVRGLNHPLLDQSFGSLSSDEFEYEITVKAVRKGPEFTPGHYRKKRADGNSGVYYFRKAPWTLPGFMSTEFSKPQNWERVKVVPE